MLAYLGLGANLGNPTAQLAQAAAALADTKGVRIAAASSLYLTTPVGGPPQPDYYNAVLVLETELSARELLVLGFALETRAGRKRTFPNAPRELDIDLLLYDDALIQEPDLQVPHPRLAERAFVLIPLAEVAPEARHPLLGQTVGELAAAISAAGVRRMADRAAWLEADKR